MEAKLFLIFFFVLMVATLREFGISGCAEAAPDARPPMVRFDVVDRNGEEFHHATCGGALVAAKPFGVVITTRKCWDKILVDVGIVKSLGDPVVYAIMNGNKVYTVDKFIDTIPTPRTDPGMDEVAKHVVMMALSGEINQVPFRYQPNLDDVQGHEPLVGTIDFPRPLMGTSADLVGNIADSWNKPYFQLTDGDNWRQNHDIGTPLYVKKDDNTRYLLGLRISEHQAINTRKLVNYTPKLVNYLTKLVGLPWRGIEGRNRPETSETRKEVSKGRAVTILSHQ